MKRKHETASDQNGPSAFPLAVFEKALRGLVGTSKGEVEAQGRSQRRRKARLAKAQKKPK